MSHDVWRTLLEAAQAGKAVSVNLTPGAEVKRPPRPRYRPRVRGIIPFAHYAGYSDGKGRPRCAYRGCRRYLKRDQHIACSPEHESAVLAEARLLLERSTRATTDQR